MSISLPLLSKLPPSPTSFQTYHAILSKQIEKLRKVVGLDTEFNYSSIFAQLSNDSLSTSEIENRLWLLILNAERAWAYGMKLKTDYQTGSSGNSVRLHSIKRFAKASKWVSTLKGLPILSSLDERGKIEVEAYTNWLQGTVSLEKEQYSQAVNHFSQSATIYEQLAKLGSLDQRSIYSKRFTEIESLVKFCQYELTRKHGNSSEIETISSLLSGERSTILSDKLEALLVEERTKQAASMETVRFLNQDILVQNERVRISIIKAQSLEKDLKNQKNNDSKLRIYERLLLAYGEGVSVLQEDVRKNISNQEFVNESRLLNSYLNYNYLMTIVNRNEILIQNLTKNDESKSSFQLNQEITHLYDIILQNMDEILDLPSIDSDKDLKECLESRKLFYRSFKLYYLSLTYKNAGKIVESFSLLKKALSVLSSASSKASKHPQSLSQLQSLESDVKKDLLLAKAQSYLNEERNQGNTVLDNLNSYPSSCDKLPELISFPPAFEMIPCKPMFFDLASNNITIPDFKSQQKKGWLGLW